MTSTKEKFLRIAYFEDTDVILPSRWQWCFAEALDRWKEGGLPADIHPFEYFGFDRVELFSINLGVVPAFDIETLKEDATRKVITDSDGAKKNVFKEHRLASMDQWLEYPVKNRKTWQEHKKRLNPHFRTRYPLWWVE